MARIQFNEGESIVGTAIIVALLGALLAAAIAFAWVHHLNKINGSDQVRPTSVVIPLGVGRFAA
jgi:hypothetical protein